MPFTDVKHDQKQTLEGMIRLFEDALIRIASNSTPTIDFDPVLVVDMRGNHFDAFVLSLRSDNTLQRLPRPIKIEEAESILAARERTPMYVYRRVRASNWTACSRGRFQQLSADNNYEVVEDLFAYTLSLSEADQNKLFERLCFSFLSLLSETDSGQDYKHILFAVDDERHSFLLQSALPRIGGKLDKGAGTKWQSAIFAVIDSKMDISPYAFLTDPCEADRTKASYLLLVDRTTGYEIHYNGLEMHSTPLDGTVAFETYDRILVIEMKDSACNLGHIEIVTADEFERMALNGYINWWLRIDDSRLDALRARQEYLHEQLKLIKQQNNYLHQLAKRMLKTLSYLKEHRG